MLYTLILYFFNYNEKQIKLQLCLFFKIFKLICIYINRYISDHR